MISALADAGAAMEDGRYLDAATQCADFLLSRMRDENGRLLRTWKDGEGRLNAYLEDHAYLVEALLVLYEATWDPRWFREARALADTMIERFADDERGGFFDTSDDHEQLVARRKSLEDNPIPSGNSSAAFGLLRLNAFTGERRYEEQAVGVFRLLRDVVPRAPQAFPHLLQALDFHFASVQEVAIVGPNAHELARFVRSKFRPHIVLAGGDADDVPLMQDRTAPGAYVCQNFACKQPVDDAAALEQLLAD